MADDVFIFESTGSSPESTDVTSFLAALRS